MNTNAFSFSMRLVAIACLLLASAGALAADPINVVVWDERQPRTQQAYPNWLGNHIANYLNQQSGITVQSVAIDDPEQGLSEDLLDDCDVLIWWGHRRHAEISDDTGRALVRRIQDGDFSLIVLHSAHWSTPFVQAMNERSKQDALKGLPRDQRLKATFNLIDGRRFNAPSHEDWITPSWRYDKNADGHPLITLNMPNCCFPDYRSDGEPSHVTTTMPDHPIAKDIPKAFDIPETEMYNEPFHVPNPDHVIFEERWDKGEFFRAGMLWNIGRGKVFYFRPGHETYKVFHEEFPLKIIHNTVKWMAEQKRMAPFHHDGIGLSSHQPDSVRKGVKLELPVENK